MENSLKKKVFYRNEYRFADIRFVLGILPFVVFLTFRLGGFGSPYFVLIFGIYVAISAYALIANSSIFQEKLHCHVYDKKIASLGKEGDAYFFQPDNQSFLIELTCDMYGAVQRGDRVYVEYSVLTKIANKLTLYYKLDQE